MKFLKQGLCLGLVASGLAVSPLIATQAGAAPGGDDRSLLAQARNEAQGGLAVTKESATGTVGFIRTDGDLLPSAAADSAKGAATKADAYLDKYSALLGAAKGQLHRSSVVKSSTDGWTVTYEQSYKGVPVFAGVVKAHVDGQGDLSSVNGFAAPRIDLSTEARKSASEAGAAAVRMVKADPTGTAESNKDVKTSGLEASPELVVYRTGSVRAETGENVLAYSVQVSNGENINEQLIVDANTGKLINRYSNIHRDLDRELYTTDFDPADPPGTPVSVTPVWAEGDAFPGALDQDQQNLLDSARESYWMFADTFGRDSFDGEGSTMTTLHNRPNSCPNASWNGSYTSYCDGVYADDVVSHEWGHAYTEFTSGLIYQWQSGALNESYSDVWGESLDLINNREDEGEGDLSVKRTTQDCDPTAPPTVEMTINSPAEVAGPCTSVFGFGPPLTTTPETVDVVVADDASNPAGPSTTDGCSAYSNAADVAGNYAYVDRGTCAFQLKADNAEAAGAAGLIIGNNAAGYPPVPSGTSDIRVFTVGQADGTRFKTAEVANVTFAAEDVSERPATNRWLIGEKSPAFGGAIRDMWKPTCYGNPGKVSDIEYNCDFAMTDSGGVHGNSGVPNHLYALAVDGGEYNGATIAGMGLDQAANVWWKVQTEYLTPISDFTDMADGLEAACAGLVGQPINQLTLGDNTPAAPATPITAANCADLSNAIDAVELRVEPVQCAFKPKFDPNTPSLCGDKFASDVLWSEDFENGLGDWTASSEVVFEGGIHDPWVTKAVNGHAGTAAFGPAPDEGECTNGAGDFSSRDSIASTVIELPDKLRSPKLTFDHSVVTEAGFDGGNVKVSVNDGPFEVIDPGAYLFNAPTKLSTDDDGSTNPLQGESGFTGTDGGTNSTAWGTSIVDVSSFAKAGDTVQFRFDIGRDGCGGISGWAVDNVKLIDCKLKTKVAAVHKPEPSTFGQASTAEVTVSRDGSTGAAPTGKVTVKDAAGKVLGSASLDDGAASVPLPADLAVGTHTLTAVYAGSSTLTGSSVNFTATVKSAGTNPPTEEGVETATKVTVKPKSPKARKAFTIVVTVKAAVGSKPTGTVVVKIDGTKVGTATVKNGTATITVKKGLKAGTHKVKAIFKGTDPYEDSRAKTKVTVKR